MDDMSLPQDVLARLEQAEQLKLSGKHREALVILEQLVMEDPSNVSALEEIADNELSMERYDRAETAAERSIALDASSYTGYYILGFIRSQQRKWAEALEHLKLANKLKANNPEILRCLGWALFQSGKRPQGIVTLERALNLDNENTLTLCDIGVAYLELRNFQKAKALFVRTLDLEPQNTRARECIEAIDRLERGTKAAAREMK